MKHIVFHHPLGTPRGASGGHAGREQWSVWRASATAVVRRLPNAPSRAARSQPAEVLARPKTFEPSAQELPAAVAPTETAAARWERRGTSAVPWVEGLVLLLLIAFFGGGLVAILGGY